MPIELLGEAGGLFIEEQYCSRCGSRLRNTDIFGALYCENCEVLFDSVIDSVYIPSEKIVKGEHYA